MFHTKSISLLTLALTLLSTPFSQAIITPTSPDGSTVVNVGSTLTALWDVDTTGNWTNVQIQLMTGDNFNMIPLTTLATGIDGTTVSSFSTPAPAVTPNAKIYFLQFTLGGDVSTATWTTRFTIAGADGSTTQPTNTTNYSGTDVQWGTGALVDPSSANTTTMNGGTNTTGTTTNSSMTSVIPSSSTTHSGLTLYNPSTTASSMTTSIGMSSTSGSASVAAASASQSRSAGENLNVGIGAGVSVGLLGMVVSLLF